MKDSIVLGWVDKAKRPSMKLQEWILLKQQEYGFDQKDLETNLEKKVYSIKETFVHSRMKRKSLFSTGVGVTSPFAKLEPRLVMFIKLSSQCNQEMKKEEILDFVNAYIRGSELERERERVHNLEDNSPQGMEKQCYYQQ